MNFDRTAPMAADSSRSQASGNGISRRDTLTLVAAGLTAPLLPTKRPHNRTAIGQDGVSIGERS